MRKIVKYCYLGTNGTICSPVHLEGIYYIRKLTLIADNNKRLTKDGINFVYTVTIPENEFEQWYEVNEI